MREKGEKGMGFLGDLFKKEAKKLVSDIVDNVIGNEPNVVNRTYSDNGSNTTYHQSSTTAARRTSTNRRPASGDAVYDTLRHIITTEFSTYELRENIPVAEFGLSEDIFYTFGMYQNGTSVLMINVYADRNQYRLKRYRLAKEVAENRGVKHLNFFTHLPNERDYIVNRLRENL